VVFRVNPGALLGMDGTANDTTSVTRSRRL
jgi:hypothetical protein